MMICTPIRLSRQRGVSLIVTLMIVVLLSLLGLYGAGVLVLDTRSAANDFRAREAVSAAESGTEQGLSFLNANRARIDEDGLDTNGVAGAEVAWTACTSSTAACLPVRPGDRTNWQYITLNAGQTSQPTAGSFTLSLLTPIPDADPEVNNGSLLVYNIVAIGLSADGTSTATVKQGAYFYPVLLGNIDTPMAAASNIPLSGNYSVITNSNGGGSGVPITAWTPCAGGVVSPCASNISTGGSFASCHVGDFDGNACPSSNAISNAGFAGPDLITDPDFPADLFQFLFGVSSADYQQIKDDATVYSNCSSLSTASSGLIWITGACNPPGNVGSADKPVLLVVQGDTTLNASSQIYGLLYMFNPTGGTAPTLTANGNAHLKGAVFAHSGVNLQLNGGFVLEYDKSVLDNLKNSPSGRGLARIPGTWSDVQQ